MCIHEIDPKRGSWQSIVFTRKHVYFVTKKYIRVVPAAASMHFFGSKQQEGPHNTPGFVVLMEQCKQRGPSIPKHHGTESNCYRRDRHKGHAKQRGDAARRAGRKR
mmetsp:Transcript_6243/g.12647  ORF Transcript_6243/g.12647 Transcript_6243/m.12647 type:complete len:106 (+) Transcript_6243:65-382(+)